MAADVELTVVVYDERRKGTIPIFVPSAKKVYYVDIRTEKPLDKNIKRKIALLVAYALDKDYEKVAKVSNSFLIQVSNVGVSNNADLNVFAQYYIIISKVTSKEEVESKIDLFFTGTAKILVEEEWKELEKTYTKSHFVEILSVLAVLVVLGFAFYLMFGGSGEEQKPPPPPPPPPTFNKQSFENAEKYLSAKVLNTIAEYTKKGDFRFKKIESVSVRKQEMGNTEVSYEVKILQKTLYPVANSTQTYCSQYSCWQKEIVVKPKMTALQYVTHPVTFPKNNIKKCYALFLKSGYLPYKVYLDSVVMRKDSDNAYQGLIELEKLYEACPFVIENLSINTGKIHVELKI